MAEKKCLCGRSIVKSFELRHGTIYLCPLCAYEITIQTALYNYSEEYITNLFKAIKRRAELKKKGDDTNGKK